MIVISMSARSAGAAAREPPQFQDVGREQKRRFILKAAAAAFGEKGFHAVTVKDIAGRAGIAHGTFYLYFKDKKDVYRELSRELRSQIMDVILPDGTSALPADGADLAAVVQQRLVGLGELFEREASFARVVVYRTPGTDPEFERERRRFVRDVTDAIAAVLRAGALHGVIRRHDPRVAAMCLVGSMEMVIESWLQTLDEEAGPSLHEMMEEAAHFFVPALVASTAGAPPDME
ncbi:MAG: TetR/AcrR family transcriptional regulator [Myxococcota bacterium]